MTATHAVVERKAADEGERKGECQSESSSQTCSIRHVMRAPQVLSGSPAQTTWWRAGQPKPSP